MSVRHGWIACALLISSAAVGQADIYRWDNDQLIPGTEEITPGPGVQLNNWNLEYAQLSLTDLIGANISSANLTGASFRSANLTRAKLVDANLTNASFLFATLANADMTGAILTGAYFAGATESGFTKEQLYSTASYQAKDLRGFSVRTPCCFPYASDLSGWNFDGQNLTGASFIAATLANTNFTDANLTNADLYTATLANADFTRANLTNAIFGSATLMNADLSQAVVRGANFYNTTSQGFTKEQLYSTASYQARDLTGIGLNGNNLNGWDFSFQNLIDAYFASSYGGNQSTMLGADLTGADVRGSSWIALAGAKSRHTILHDGRINGLELAAGETALVRDDDGVPAQSLSGRASRPPIPVSIQDRLTIAEGGVLQLLVDADPWDSLISFEPGIPVQLDGTLELTFADDVKPASQLGRTLRIFDWTGVSPSGQFAIRSPYVWDLTKLYTTGEVRLIAVPEPSALAIEGFAFSCLLAQRRKLLVSPKMTGVIARQRFRTRAVRKRTLT